MKNIFIFCFLVFSSLAQAGNITVDLSQVRLADLAKIVYGDISKKSYILDDEFLNNENVITVKWSNISSIEIEKLTKQMIEKNGFEFDLIGNVSIIRKHKKSDEQVFIYKPRFRSSKYLSDVLEKVLNISPLGTRKIQATPVQQQAISKQPEIQGAASQQFDKSASDQIAFECRFVECSRISSILTQLDTPEAQVILRAVLYEVGTTSSEGSALQLASSIINNAQSLSVQTGGVLSGASSIHLVSQGLDAVVSLLDNDSRFKSVSRPMLRVRSGNQAKFSVGQSVPVLGSVSYDKNGAAVQSVNYKQSGTIFTVTPDVRADIVDLNISQELSSFVQTTTGVNNSPTLLQRTVSSQLSIKSKEVVVFAGLEESKNDQTNSRFFGFNVGKTKGETKTELLLFVEAEII